MQDAAAAAKAFSEKLEAERNNLTPNQLKKQRKKRAKLFQQAALSELVDGCQPSKRTKLDTSLEASTSSQLDPSSCQQGHACCEALPGQQLQPMTCPTGSIQSGTHHSIAAHSEDGAEESHHQQQAKQQRQKPKQKPLLARPLKPLKPRTLPQPDRRVGGAGQASDMSHVFVALQHQTRCDQYNQEQQKIEQPPISLQVAPAVEAEAALELDQQAVQAIPDIAAATGAVGPHGSILPCGSSSSSRGPCRADLSSHLVVMKPQLSGSNDHSSSSSTLMHVLQLDGGSSTGDHSSHDQQEQQQQQQRGHQQQQQQLSRKRQRPSCLYGNYHHYYGYRIGPSGFEDPRLKVLDPAWFKGADVLDVGCNEGLLTMALAVGCGCRSVLGVDIDPALVAKACTNLSRSRSQLTQQLRAAVAARDAASVGSGIALPSPQQPQQQQASSSSTAASAVEGPASIIAACSMALVGSSSSSRSNKHNEAAALQDCSDGGSGTAIAAAGEQDASQAQERQQQQQQQDMSEQASVLQLSKQIKSLTRVSFRAGNWLEMGSPANKYEVVTCFSVTKWVHLNWGDDGIMKLFHKFYRCLAPGGLLVLEPQPFKSYHNAVHKQGVQAAPFRNIEQLKLRPEGFCAFLTQRVGFELVQQLNTVSQVAGEEAVPVKGFDRPLLVLRKPAKQG